ncbi:MAG: tetratricopeptide repeat protein [Candidatus Muiribacteriota bacterium]
MKKNRMLYVVFFVITIIYAIKYRKINEKIIKIKVSSKLKKYTKIALSSTDILEKAAAWYMIANIYCFDLREYLKAMDYYQKILSVSENTYLEDSALFNMGICAKNLNDRKGAKNYFDEVIKKFPETARAKDAELELSRL